MTKSSLIEKLALEYGISASQARMLVDTLFDVILQIVAEGGAISLRGFGTFAMKQRAACERRNPRTGNVIQVRAKKHFTFKPSRGLNGRLNRGL